MAETSKSCDLPKKEIFDGLHKCLKNAFEGIIPKKEIPFQEIFDGLHKQLKNAFGRNFLKRKLYAREFRKMPEKS